MGGFCCILLYVDCVRKLSQQAFAEKYKAFCKKHGYNFKEAKALEIYAQSKELLPMLPKDTLSKVILKEAVNQLGTISKTVEIFRQQMNQLASQLPEPQSCHGAIRGWRLLGASSDGRDWRCAPLCSQGFSNRFCRVDPGPNQSGTYEAKSTRSSKRGSPELRKTLFILMTVLLQKAPQDDTVYQFLGKKCAEGKPYYVYMTAGCNKFLRIYYGRIKEYFSTFQTNG